MTDEWKRSYRGAAARAGGDQLLRFKGYPQGRIRRAGGSKQRIVAGKAFGIVGQGGALRAGLGQGWRRRRHQHRQHKGENQSFHERYAPSRTVALIGLLY